MCNRKYKDVIISPGVYYKEMTFYRCSECGDFFEEKNKYDLHRRILKIQKITEEINRWKNL